MLKVSFSCALLLDANFKPIGLQVRSSLGDETSAASSVDNSLEHTSIEVCPVFFY